jgi:hypothetical protein
MNTPPPGYNASESLLNGGTDSNITPVMGGGRGRKSRSASRGRSRSRSRSKSRSRSASRGKSRQRGGAKPFALKKVSKGSPLTNLAIEPVDLDNWYRRIGTAKLLDEINVPDSEKQGNLRVYYDKQIELWKRVPKEGIVTSSPQIINLLKVGANRANIDKDTAYLGQGGFDRLTYVVPENIGAIFLMPPVNGDLDIFMKCFNIITDDKMNKKEHLILFSPPFYTYYSTENDNTKSKNNNQLLHSFLKLKGMVQSTLLILTEYTRGSIHTDVNNTNANINNTFITKLEPTYVVLQRAVQVGEEKLQGIIFSAAAEDEPILPTSSSVSVLGAIAAAEAGNKGGLCFPPNLKAEDKLLKGKTYPYKFVRFFVNTRTILDKVDTSKGDTILYDIGKKEVALFEANKASKTFSSSPAAYSSSDVTLVSIPLGTQTYLLRHPRTRLVVDDWNNLIFTEDEADFLNDMKLRPDMLAEIHGEDTWANTLSTHMGTIVRSKCFSDNRLVLHSDCQQTQRFIAGVMEYYMKNDMRLKAIDDRELAAGDRDIEIRLDRERTKKGAESLMPKGATPEKWAKDPFTGANAPLTLTANSDDITAGITFNTRGRCGNNLHTRIIAVHAKELLDGEKADILRRTGVLSVAANEGDTVEGAKRALQDKYDLIKNTYPRFLFFP